MNDFTRATIELIGWIVLGFVWKHRPRANRARGQRQTPQKGN